MGIETNKVGKPILKRSFPSERAQALCTLNPLTFKKQNVNGVLDKIIKSEYDAAVDYYLRHKI